MYRRRARDPPAQASNNSHSAGSIWKSAPSIRATLAEAYLRGRQINIDQIPDVDDVLRFDPHCPFGPNCSLPCLVALVRDALTNEPRAIQRTALNANGEKIGRLSLGPTKGGAIKLWGDAAVTTGLCVGEGMETIASAALRITHKGTLLQPAWSLLDRGNLGAFPVLAGIEVLTILVDNDASGDGQADAETCAQRWCNAGRDVIRLTPKTRGSDFNDIVRGAT